MMMPYGIVLVYYVRFVLKINQLSHSRTNGFSFSTFKQLLREKKSRKKKNSRHSFSFCNFNLQVGWRKYVVAVVMFVYQPVREIFFFMIFVTQLHYQKKYCIRNQLFLQLLIATLVKILRGGYCSGIELQVLLVFALLKYTKYCWSRVARLGPLEEKATTASVIAAAAFSGADLEPMLNYQR